VVDRSYEATYASGVHELSICSAIAQIVERTAAGRRVERVRVDVGHLHQVVPDTLSHSWEMVVFATALEGSVLDISYIPAVIECRACGRRTQLAEPLFRCGECGSTETDVVTGNEMLVSSLDVARD
jgi:hydrogenase nickel incorporation protein HypA/HybF